METNERQKGSRRSLRRRRPVSKANAVAFSGFEQREIQQVLLVSAPTAFIMLRRVVLLREVSFEEHHEPNS